MADPAHRAADEDTAASAPPTRIETPRLLLRRPERGDAAALFAAYAGDPQATAYLSWRTHERVTETETFVAGAIDRWDADEAYVWTIGARDHDGPIGAVSAEPGPHGVEIGYVVGRAWWGHGLASEAAGAVVEHLRTRPDVYRVWAYCAVGHHRSARVLQRCGLAREATLRRWIVLPNLADEPCDAWSFAWTRPGRC